MDFNGVVRPFQLPPKRVFEPPSYPNVWFYVHDALASSQEEAVKQVDAWLREHIGLVNDFGRFKPPEASDFQARLSGLQPWEDAPDPHLRHAHDLHIRYYYISLRQTEQDRAVLDADVAGVPGLYYRFAGSVHYEVEDEHPLHPYVDECPHCGRTGAYVQAEDLFAGVHEPLGLELLLYGKIRGQQIYRRAGSLVGGVVQMGERYALRIHELPPTRGDMNVVRLAAAVIGPKG